MSWRSQQFLFRMTGRTSLDYFHSGQSHHFPHGWDSWFGQFSLALGIKDHFNVSDIVVEPGDVHDDPLPRPESRP